jgi:hypothetical protein
MRCNGSCKLQPANARSANASSAVWSGAHFAYTSVVEYDACPDQPLKDAQRDTGRRHHRPVGVGRSWNRTLRTPAASRAVLKRSRIV